MAPSCYWRPPFAGTGLLQRLPSPVANRSAKSSRGGGSPTHEIRPPLPKPLPVLPSALHPQLVDTGAASGKTTPSTPLFTVVPPQAGVVTGPEVQSPMAMIDASALNSARAAARSILQQEHQEREAVRKPKVVEQPSKKPSPSVATYLAEQGIEDQ